jgi:hypothetical protein
MRHFDMLQEHGTEWKAWLRKNAPQRLMALHDIKV